MKTAVIGLVMLSSAGTAAAQAPVQDRASRDQAIQASQLRAGMAHSVLQQALLEVKLAEQEFVSTQQAQRAAQKQADEMKRELDITKKTLDAARQKEAQARKAYDEALNAVERARQPASAK